MSIVCLNIFVTLYTLKASVVWELLYKPYPLPGTLLPQISPCFVWQSGLWADVISSETAFLTTLKLHTHHSIPVTWVSFLLIIHHCLTLYHVLFCLFPVKITGKMWAIGMFLLDPLPRVEELEDGQVHSGP